MSEATPELVANQPPGNQPPDVMTDAIEPDAALARKNNHFGLWLALLFILLFGGTFLIGLLYNSVTTT
jgi:hypothetical protein